MWRYTRGQRPSSCPQGACKYSSWLESRFPVRSAEGCRAVQGGAGQGVHMPKRRPGGGGGGWTWGGGGEGTSKTSLSG